MYGLRSSSLTCFYNSTCLNDVAYFIGTNSTLDPLNNSISSISFGTLIDELFIETWDNSSNYSNTCAPLTCQYSYTDHEYCYLFSFFSFLKIFNHAIQIIVTYISLLKLFSLFFFFK